MTVAAVEDPASPDEFDVDPPFDPAQSALPADRFLDRELSWIAFNSRVLELAQDESLPLLERVRFLAIFASNLDEFFMVRVAGLKRRIAAGVAVPSASGLNPRNVLTRSLEATQDLMVRHAETYHSHLVPALASEGIELLHWDALRPSEQEQISALYRDRVFPVLTPLAVDP
ncbi:MAG: RNA degradosome polyphosphate kinase, partial [Aeromicrobium sp.]